MPVRKIIVCKPLISDEELRNDIPKDLRAFILNSSNVLKGQREDKHIEFFKGKTNWLHKRKLNRLLSYKEIDSLNTSYFTRQDDAGRQKNYYVWYNVEMYYLITQKVEMLVQSIMHSTDDLDKNFDLLLYNLVKQRLSELTD